MQWLVRVRKTYDVGLLDCRTIRYGIREWHTKLYDVCSSLLHGQEDGDSVLHLGIARSHESDQGRAGLGARVSCKVKFEETATYCLVLLFKHLFECVHGVRYECGSQGQ